MKTSIQPFMKVIQQEPKISTIELYTFRDIFLVAFHVCFICLKVNQLSSIQRHILKETTDLLSLYVL